MRIFNPIINDTIFYLNSLREARSNIFFILYLPTQQRKMAKGLYEEIRK